MYEKLKELREKTKKRAIRHDPYRPVAYWSEKDNVMGKTVRAFVAILRTRGCYWALSGGCTMCGYIQDAYMRPVEDDQLRAQLEIIRNGYSGEEYVKIFTSGSFLDKEEVPTKLYDDIFSSFSTAKVISIETRPEFVTRDSLENLKRVGKKYGLEIEVSIGLESSNENILKNLINKGFGIDSYVRAAKLLKDEGFFVKTYILLKPPFVSEYYAMRDAINSILFASNFSDKISINPTVIQRFTIVEDLNRRGLYKTPWVYTLMVVLKRAKLERRDSIIVSYPMKKLKEGGLRGCKECLGEHIQRIIDFSLTQDVSKLKIDENCWCYEIWKKELYVSKKNPYLP